MNQKEQNEVIRIEKLWTQFGQNVIHRDLDLVINRGDIV